MTPWRDLWRKIAPRRSVEPDVDEELSFHIEGKTRALMRDRGMTEDEARREALRRFGDWDDVTAATRRYARQRAGQEERRAMLDTLKHDLSLAMKALTRNAGFTSVVVLTLALGIGAATAIFSVVNGVLLRPLPYPDADRLVVVWQNDRNTGTVREPASPADFFDFQERARSFSEVAMSATFPVTLNRDDGEPRRLTAAAVSHELDRVLEIEPVRGRSFTPEDDRPGTDGMALISHGLWTDEWHRDPSVIGRTVRVSGTPVTVLGVLPPDLEYPTPDVDLWLPLRVSRAEAPRQQHYVRVLARLAPGVTVDQAQGEMTRIAAELEATYPANAARGAFVEPLDDVKRGGVRRTLWVLFGAVLTLLLIACANVANLLLARGAARARELAVHAALGAGAGRLARRFLLEGFLVASMAVALGVALAFAGTGVLGALAPSQLLELGQASAEALGPDLRVLGFAGALAAVVGLGFGALPTLQARRLDLRSSLGHGGRSGGAGGGRAGPLGLRRLLVAGQVGLATVLLVGAGLLGATLRNLSSVDPGFRSQGVLKASFTEPAGKYPKPLQEWPDWPEVHQLHRGILRSLDAVPGVESAALAVHHPLESGFTNSYAVVGRRPDPSQGEMSVRMVTPGYFETAGVPLVRGRLFEGGPRDGAFQMVLNREAARRVFPEGDALGSRISMWGGNEFEVVGVVESERIFGVENEAPPAFYIDLLQAPSRGTAARLLVRSSVADPMELAGPVRQAVWDVDPEVAVYDVATMSQTLRQATARERFASVLVGVFAGLAVLLAVMGVHGVLSYLVARRGREVGVRMALGATRGRVVWMVLRQGLAMTGLGLVLGLGVALAGSRVLGSLLYGVSATEPVAYLGVAVVLASAGALAAFLPARRAAGVDPAGALRGE